MSWHGWAQGADSSLSIRGTDDRIGLFLQVGEQSVCLAMLNGETSATLLQEWMDQAFSATAEVNIGLLEKVRGHEQQS